MGSGISTKYEKTEGLKSFEDAKTGGNKVSEVKNTMPCYRKAFVDSKKFVEYSLDTTHPIGKHKALIYKEALGYDSSNYETLIKQIENYVQDDTSIPNRIENTTWGPRYQYNVPVKGLNGLERLVLTVFQIDSDSCIPRLITNYVLPQE